MYNNRDTLFNLLRHFYYQLYKLAFKSAVSLTNIRIINYSDGQFSWQWSLKLFNQWWSLLASVPITCGWWIDHVWMVVCMFSEYCSDIKLGDLYSSVLQPCLDVACVRTRENFVLFSVNHSARPLICLTFSSFSIFAKNCQETNRVSQRSAYLKNIFS